MTPRSLWSILIKILGVYFILESIVGMPQFLIVLWGLARNSPENSSSIYIWLQVIFYSFTFVTYYLIFKYSVFKTDWIIDKLKLDQDYEEQKFEFNIHRSTVLKIIVMITGLLFLADSVPMFLKVLMAYFQQVKDFKNFTDYPEAKFLVFYLVKGCIGYFMLTCSRMIVNYIELKRKNPVTTVEDTEL